MVIGMRTSAIIVLLLCSFPDSMAQDVLPDFTAVTRGNGKIIISWTNPYPVVTQINIQRSKDSTKGFASIMGVPDPTAQQNGFVDSKAPDPRFFYRLFVVLDSGKYVFTKSKRAFFDTAKVAAAAVANANKPATNENTKQRVVIAEKVTPKQAEEIKEKLQTAAAPPKPAEPEKFFVIKRRDSIITQVAAKDYKRFRDSIVTKSKDTIAFASVDTIVLKPFIPREIYKPSRYVFTERDGNVAINVADPEDHNYSVKFFTDADSPVFQIEKVKESPVLIDKANFLQSGWFKFELYEDGKLKEKHKFYIPKDF